MINDLLQKMNDKYVSTIDIVKMYGVLSNLKIDDLNYIKIFINNYYNLEEELPEKFYIMFFNTIHGDKYKELLDIILQKDIYVLINFLKYGKNYKLKLDESITPLKYFNSF